jgi:hypothetical protein
MEPAAILAYPHQGSKPRSDAPVLNQEFVASIENLIHVEGAAMKEFFFSPTP